MQLQKYYVPLRRHSNTGFERQCGYTLVFDSVLDFIANLDCIAMLQTMI